MYCATSLGSRTDSAAPTTAVSSITAPQTELPLSMIVSRYLQYCSWALLPGSGSPAVERQALHSLLPKPGCYRPCCATALRLAVATRFPLIRPPLSCCCLRANGFGRSCIHAAQFRARLANSKPSDDRRRTPCVPGRSQVCGEVAARCARRREDRESSRDSRSMWCRRREGVGRMAARLRVGRFGLVIRQERASVPADRGPKTMR